MTNEIKNGKISKIGKDSNKRVVGKDTNIKMPFHNI